MTKHITEILPPQENFLHTPSSRLLLSATIAVAITYFLIVILLFHKGNSVLFYLLIAGEVFHLWQIITYSYTVWNTEYFPPFDPKLTPGVDVFITVAGEPVDIVEETAQAALNMSYPNFKVYLLNDGLVAKKDNWKDIKILAKKLGITCITRSKPGGAKAGNINHALKKTRNPFIAVFDADQVPYPDFLEKMMGYFGEEKMGFAQSPQYYKNFQTNEITRGAWEQQELFFGPLCKGKNRLNATFMCGTNMVIRRKTLLEAGGMYEDNIAEDFLTSLFIHQRGWKSVYVPEVLAEGLAPEDFQSYYKQQYRWARGSLEVIFKHNPLFIRGLSFSQRMQYLASASYYLSGLVIVMNALLPIIFFFTGLIPITMSSMGLAVIFLPYIALILLSLRATSNFAYSFRAIAFSMSSFGLQIQAMFSVLLNIKTAFSVTSKNDLQETSYTWPRRIYCI